MRSGKPLLIDPVLVNLFVAIPGRPHLMMKERRASSVKAMLQRQCNEYAE